MTEAFAMDRDDSARLQDTNGWFEVRDNPISKVGVFQYLGKSIPGADPEQIYNVYRSAEQLGSPETLASLRLQPWIDDHVMLGSKEKGFMPAEEKTVHGVIGEQVYFEGDTLYANLKMFSEAMAQSIASGKKELSLGYRCKYVKTSGVFNGQKYDYVQVNIRCNHIASVDEGRMGADVSVLDHFTFTFDEKDIKNMADPTDKPAADPGAAGDMSITDALAAVSLLLPVLQKLAAAQAPVTDPAPADPAPADPDPADKPIVTAGDADPASGDKPEDKKDDAAKAMDAAIKRAVKLQVAAAMDAMPKQLSAIDLARAIGQRDKLATDLVPHVGTFDHSDMTASQVAAYGIQKLGLKAEKGTEAAILSGYLQGRKAPAAQAVASFGMDSATGGDDNYVNKFLKGGV